MSVSAPAPGDFEAISFPGWKAALASARVLPEARERYRGAILALLKTCKDRRRPVSVALIREHLAVVKNPVAIEALRWFWTAAREAERAKLGAGEGGIFNAQRLTSNAEGLSSEAVAVGAGGSGASPVVTEPTGGEPVPRSEQNGGGEAARGSRGARELKARWGHRAPPVGIRAGRAGAPALPEECRRRRRRTRVAQHGSGG